MIAEFVPEAGAVKTTVLPVDRSALESDTTAPMRAPVRPYPEGSEKPRTCAEPGVKPVKE